MKFPFKSKLDRHLKSDDHRMFAKCLETSIAIDDDIEYLFPASSYAKEVAILSSYVHSTRTGVILHATRLLIEVCGMRD